MNKQNNPFEGLTAYISGAITDVNFKVKFDKWEKALKEKGFKRILNPTIFPPEWSYSEYMEHCLLMVRHADIIVALPDRIFSKGAQAEIAYAKCLTKDILYPQSIDEFLNE